MRDDKLQEHPEEPPRVEEESFFSPPALVVITCTHNKRTTRLFAPHSLAIGLLGGGES